MREASVVFNSEKARVSPLAAWTIVNHFRRLATAWHQLGVASHDTG